MDKFSGSCLCGNIHFGTINLKDTWYYQQCRNITGHFMTASQVQLDAISIRGTVKWFYVSQQPQHDFCSDCDSQLFWQNDNNDYLSVCLGDTKLLIAKGHIFTKEKTQYYKLADNLPKYATWWPEL